MYTIQDLNNHVAMKCNYCNHAMVKSGFFFILVASMAFFSLSAFTFSMDSRYVLSYLVFAQQPQQTPEQTKKPAGGDTTLNLESLIGHGSPYLGNKSTASAVIVDFSDFQCYLCKRHVDNAERDLKSSFIQGGKVVYVFKHLPNRGLDSKNAAMAAQCANDQGRFWDYHGLLYASQGPIDSGWVSPENLKVYASKIKGIDMSEFDSCLDGKKHEEFVDGDIRFANSGIYRDPLFYNNGSPGVKNP